MPRRQAKRCQLCDRPGLGTPPLCRDHFEALLSGDGIDREEIFDAIYDWASEHIPPFLNHLFSSLYERPEESPHYQGPGRGYFADTSGPSSRGPRGARGANGHAHSDAPPPPPPPPQDDFATARKVLHFGPSETLTRERVEKRRRELARLCHPDAGGDVEAAQVVNSAADLLLSAL